MLVEQTGSPAWRAALALVHLEKGLRTQSRAGLQQLHDDGLASLPRDWLRVLTLSYLAEVNAALEDRASAHTLWELLCPHADTKVVVAYGVLSLGAADGYLALLADVLGDRNTADHQFRRAAELNQRWRLRPQLVRTHLAHARALHASDPALAARLRTAAMRTAHALGMASVSTDL